MDKGYGKRQVLPGQTKKMQQHITHFCNFTSLLTIILFTEKEELLTIITKKIKGTIHASSGGNRSFHSPMQLWKHLLRLFLGVQAISDYCLRVSYSK